MWRLTHVEAHPCGGSHMWRLTHVEAAHTCGGGSHIWRRLTHVEAHPCGGSHMWRLTHVAASTYDNPGNTITIVII